MTGRIELPLRTAGKLVGYDGLRSDDFAPFELPKPGPRLKKREGRVPFVPIFFPYPVSGQSSRGEPER
jgi:hypothetical protein